MSDTTPVAVPTAQIIVPAPPSPTAALEEEADNAIRYLELFINSSGLDTDIRLGMQDVRATIKNLKQTVMTQASIQQRTHDQMVELTTAQRLI